MSVNLHAFMCTYTGHQVLGDVSILVLEASEIAWESDAWDRIGIYRSFFMLCLKGELLSLVSFYGRAPAECRCLHVHSCWKHLAQVL